MTVTIHKSDALKGHWELVAEQTIDLPLDEVFAFFADAYNLERITPAFLKFNVVTPKPIPMHEGALIDYKLRVHGVPIKWRTEIAAWEPPQRFIDQQLKGPYTTWHHEHTFEAIGPSQTLVRDVVTYRPPFGAFANWLMVERDVRKIFEHRQTVLAEILQPSEAARAKSA